MKKSNIIKIIQPALIWMIVLSGVSYISPLQAEIIGPAMDRVVDEQEMVAAINAVMLTNKSGASVPLSKYIGQDKPTLITLWERDCINCLVEMRGMKKIAEICPNNWNVLFISIAHNQSEKDHIRFDKYKLPWPLYHLGATYFTDANQINIRKAFFGETWDGVVATPLHYLISKNGTVDAIVNAKLDFEEPRRLMAFCEK